MKPAFRNLSPEVPCVEILWDGAPLQLPNGANLAGALLAAGIGTFRRTPVSGAPRAPYCMMGSCYDCLVTIAGVTRQACQMTVSAGLVVAPAGGSDA